MVKCKINFLLCEIISPTLIFLQLCKSAFVSFKYFFIRETYLQENYKGKQWFRDYILYIVFLYVLWINIFSFPLRFDMQGLQYSWNHFLTRKSFCIILTGTHFYRISVGFFLIFVSGQRNHHNCKMNISGVTSTCLEYFRDRKILCCCY